MNTMTASKDVSDELHSLSVRTSLIEQSQEQMNEMLKKLGDVLISNAGISKQLVHIEKRLDSSDVRYDKLEGRISKNHDKIIYWSGGLAAMLLVAGLLLKDIKLASPLQSTPAARIDSPALLPQRQELPRSTKE